MKDQLISVKDASRIRGVSRQTIAYYIKSGKLPAQKIGRTLIVSRKAVMKVTTRRQKAKM